MQATNYPIQPQNNQQQKFLNQILTKKTRKKKNYKKLQKLLNDQKSYSEEP